MVGSSVADQLHQVLERMAQSARRAGRAASDVRLVAVSKKQPVEKIRQAVLAGHTIFGENYVQEALQHQAALALAGSAPTASDSQLEWHLIGPLQSNKVKQVLGQFALLHAIDRASIAEALSRHASQMGLTQAILIEVNVAHEASKSGVAAAESPELFRRLAALPGLELRGLMVMPPMSSNPEASRPYFAKARQLLHELQTVVPNARELSMGTSQDYTVAIEEGATLVRIGSEIFGARQ